MRINTRSRPAMSGHKQTRAVGHYFGIASLSFFALFLIISAAPNLLTGGLIDDAVNGFVPLYIALVSVGLALLVIKKNPGSVWTPLFFFPLQSAVFLGIGPLVEVFGNEATRSFASQHLLAVSVEGFARANKLSVLGIGLVYFGIWLHSIVNSKNWSNPNRISKNLPPLAIDPRLFAIVFTVIGFVFLVFILRPAKWGIITLVIPGFFTSTGSIMVHVGFGLVAYLMAQGDRRSTLFFLTLWPINFILTLLTFSKAEIISSMLFPVIAMYVAKPKFLRLVISLTIVAMVYTWSQGFIQQSRAVILDRTGSISQAGYVERFEIAFDSIFNEDETTGLSSSSEQQGWWTRLNYISVQSFAMDAYDTGQTFDTFRYAFIRFIPRFFWPDKPIIVGAGIEFNYALTGRTTSSLGLTIYGDAYLQYGWIGVLSIMPLIGWFFASISIWGQYIVDARQLFYFPLVLLGMRISVFGPLTFILDGIITSGVMIVCYYLLMRVLATTLFSGQNRGNQIPRHIPLPK